MATTSEEVLMHLGFSTSAFDAGVRKVEGQMAETASHIVEHMERPRAATLAWHKAMHEITAISPALGTALQAVFNPAVGAITAGVFVLKGFYDGMKEVAAMTKEANKAMQEMQELAAKPIGNVTKAKEEAAKESDKERRQFAKDNAEELFKNLGTDPEALQFEIDRRRNAMNRFRSPEGLQERDTLRLSREKAEQQIKSDEEELKKHEEIQKKFKAIYDEEQKRKEEAAKSAPAQGAFGGVGLTFQAGGLLAQVEAYENASKAIKVYEENLKKTRAEHAKLDVQLRDDLATYEAEKSELGKLEAEHKKVSEARLKLAWEAARDEDEVFKWAAEQKKKHHEKEVQQMEFDQRLAKLMREEKRAEIEPFLPTIQQLAKIPNWGGDTFGFNMPQGPLIPTDQAQKAGEMARELQAREHDLRATILAEGPKSSRAQEDLNRINQLKGALEKSGFMKVDHAEKMSEALQDLLKLGAEKGLLIKPMNGA